jgi:chorismate lyase / 3-hydroxybenzoate synthase
MSTSLPDLKAASAALSVGYLPSDQLDAQPSSWWRQVLGVVGFGAVRLPRALAPTLDISTPQLLPQSSLCETWRVADDVTVLTGVSRSGRVQYRYTDELLFGCLSVHESEFDTRPTRLPDAAGCEALMRATEEAYHELFAVLNETQHRQLVRIWNYLPQINDSIDGEERYRRFNAARQVAFRHAGRAVMGSVPAACALGSPIGSPLSVYFLAARRAARVIENPRQTSAYHYPPQFGRHSPTFSRACLWGGEGTTLFISGTASIVGHETLHRGDVVAQTRETLANIELLLGEANRISGSSRYTLGGLNLKVYVRHAADLPAIEAVLRAAIGGTQPLYLLADICRDDLLVEIEATG